MFNTLRNAWKIPDLRQKMLFTLVMLIIFRLGSFIPVPGMNTEALSRLIQSGGLLGFFNTISGGAFDNFAIFAMSITPYINSTIIMQLLTIAIPSLEALAKEGEEGRRKIAQYTRYGTVVLALIQAAALSYGLRGYLLRTDAASVILVALSLTAGTAFLMWLGEQINEKGIGNGISLLIFAGIISRVPGGALKIFELYKVKSTNLIEIAFFLIFAILIIMAVIFIQEGERRIPVQYAKRVVGRRMYGGQSTHIPLKVNQAGVIPVIFAMSLIAFPGQIAQFFPNSWAYRFFNTYLGWGSWAHSILYALLIIGFTYFYTAVSFNPIEVANNIKKYGGFIPGIRPGKPTSDFITKSLNRITLVGAFFLAVIAIVPIFLMNFTGIKVYFGSTSLLIVVGVAMDFVKQVEAQMVMRNYQGFLK
ncbi:MAG TPA: preprotein translocase subunit SecY [Bacillota bacterium]|nr:preprotein translocase subunit SecY [Clostridiaceae bacterium]HNR03557.1 preprotein translocase subunit SecY [Bacillota bacterium]HNT02721.1 preprotein translocase subunit SecY [Bacillota bacterium]HPA54519.1 preprotein translocase subunit SecY [Bacillota bacterium]HPX68058.1 preprotein translocase subunit SecY [Bacillota bacterium]